MMTDSETARSRAEALFKRKDEQADKGTESWSAYQAEQRATLEKTERLRALRLAKEYAHVQRATKPKLTPK
jgi:hypothetical protein